MGPSTFTHKQYNDEIYIINHNNVIPDNCWTLANNHNKQYFF